MKGRSRAGAGLAISWLLVGLLAAAVGSHAGQKQAALDDGAIIAIYNQVNSMDVETALIGQLKGHSAHVRALAKMVAADHTGVRKAAHALAAKIGVVPTLPPGRAAAAGAHYEAVAKLHEQHGAAFDRLYLEHEVAFHESAIEALNKVLVPASTHPELKAHFKAVLPHFEHHLAETRRIAKLLAAK